MGVQAANRLNHLCGVDSCTLFCEAGVFPEVSEHLTTVKEIDNEVELRLSLEREVKANDVGVLDLLEDVTLGYTR